MPHSEQITFNSKPIVLDKFFLKLKERFEVLQFDCDTAGVITTINLFDLDTIFLAVKDFNDNRNFTIENKPIAKGSNLDLRDLRPNADWKSTAFLYEHSPRNILRSKIELDLSFVVSYQQKLLIPSLGYQMSEDLYSLVEQTIMDLKNDNTDIQTFTNRDNVFQDFNVDYFNTMFTNEFNHFRIRFKTLVDRNCVGFGNKLIFIK